jgi:hypothetical protein
VIVPPFADAVAVVIPVPFVKVNVFWLYVRSDGITSLTTMVMLAVSVPPVLVAVMV